MQLKSVDIQVYKLDNDGTFMSIGQINQFTSLMWPDKYDDFATFELNAPATQENRNLLKKGNIIWCGGDNAAKIEIVKSDKKNNGQKTFNVKGRTLEALLTTRIIWGTYYCTNTYASTAMYDIVNANCVHVSDPARKIPFLECAIDYELGKKVAFQKTGGEVYDAVRALAIDSEIGFKVLFRPKEKKLIFEVVEGVDRTINLLSNEGKSSIVIFSTDLEDILSSSYYTNDQDVKTLAYVAGEGTGSERKYIISGNNASSGFDRKETYIDARDIQSEIMQEDGTTTVITNDDYNDLLDDRGKEKLAECVSVETFEAVMRVIGDVQYIYGIDYLQGDKVIVQDEELGIQIIARVMGVSENFDDEYELEITFGYEQPTQIQRIKRQILK